MDGYKKNRLNFNKTLDKKLTTNNPLNMDTLADIHFYRQIEKRGFYAWLKEVSISWDDLNMYVLRKMTDNDTLEWERFNKPNFETRIKSMK